MLLERGGDGLIPASVVANRVLSVGSLGRAQLLSKLLDEGSLKTYESSRGFTIFTGLMDGVAVSIIATGMVGSSWL